MTETSQKETPPSEKNNVLGIPIGQQIKTPKNIVARKVKWYNKKGETIGWGDLSYADLKNISEKIDPQEIFIILHGSHLGEESKSQDPKPLRYIIDNAWFIVTKNQCCIVLKTSHDPRTPQYIINGTFFTVINSTQLLELMQKNT